MSFSISNVVGLLKNAYRLLRNNDPLILSSSTAFFATFSLSPIIILLVNLLGLYFRRDDIRNRLFIKVSSIFGDETAREISKIVYNFRAFESNIWITILGSIFLLFVATTLLSIVRQAIHKLWRIKKKPLKRLRYNVKERLIEMSMVLLIGLLFLFSLSLDTSVAIFRDYLDEIMPGINVTLIRVVNILFSIVVVTVWFMIVFKLLPEARVRWKVAFGGGLFTGILYSIGKFILGKFLIHANVASIFGASASFAILLLFVFYCSFILYYGAAFTHEYAVAIKLPILPGKYADEYEEKLIVRDE